MESGGMLRSSVLTREDQYTPRAWKSVSGLDMPANFYSDLLDRIGAGSPTLIWGAYCDAVGRARE
jgi:hypothetical protein